MRQSGKEYVITDGNGYIRQNISGHYELTSNITLAETFKRYNLAKSVWQYALSKLLRKKTYIATLSADGLVQPVIRHQGQEKDNCEASENKEYVFHADSNVQKWLDKLGQIDTIFDQAKDRQAEVLS